MSDRRVKYTKMVLKESLLKLMEEKPIGKIQIKEICELADVNRGTFYTHYNDQYDLLKHIQDEFAAEVIELRNKKLSNTMDGRELITKLLSYVAEQRSLCKLLFSTNGNELINKLMNIAYDNFIDNWKQSHSRLSEWQIDMLYVFISSGAASIIRHWALNDMKQPPKEIAQFIIQAITYGGNSFLQKANNTSPP